MKVQKKKSYRVGDLSHKIGESVPSPTFRQNAHRDEQYFEQNILTAVQQSQIRKEDKFVPKLSARRWLYLVISVILNITDGALWICFASVANMAASYYKVSLTAVNWLSMVFFYVYMPIIFLAMYVYMKWGHRAGFYLGCGTNLIGSVIRLFGTFDFVPVQYRYGITLAGQFIASFTQPFCMCMPTRISQDWFPENERTISTNLISLSNLTGSMIACLLSPALVTQPEKIALMNFVICGSGIFAGLLGVLVCKSLPESPPSISAAEIRENEIEHNLMSFINDLKKLLTNPHYLILNLTAAATGVGFVYTLLTVLQQMLCSFDYSNSFSGLCTALMIAGGIVGSIAFTALAEKTKKLEEIIKIGFSISVILDIVLVMISNIRGIPIPIAIVCVALGLIGLGIYPVCLEVAVEITYPIDQSLSAGLIAFWQQIQGAAFVPLITSFGVKLNSYQMQHQTCTVGDLAVAFDMTNGVLFLVGLITLFDIVLIIFFHPVMKRSEIEKLKRQQNLQIAIRDGIIHAGNAMVPVSQIQKTSIREVNNEMTIKNFQFTNRL